MAASGHEYACSQDLEIGSNILFTVEDESWSHNNIRFKGTMTNWVTVEMYDDGTNGDQFADDHIWSVLIENISPRRNVFN